MSEDKGYSKEVSKQTINHKKNGELFSDAIKKNQLLGSFIQTPHQIISEYISSLGLDFIILDGEHSVYQIDKLHAMVRGNRNTNTYTMVRVPTLSYEYISQYLDLGADSILVPQAQSVKDVERLKEYVMYPPHGKRGIGPVAMVDYGLSLNSFREDKYRILNIALQIETKGAFDDLDKILEYDFIDSIFIGPVDLSMSLGIFMEFDNPILTDAIEEIIYKTKKAGKSVGIYGSTPESADKWLNKGVNYVAISTELSLIADGLKTFLGNMKNQAK